jgi:hypothetical protein
MKKSHLIFTSVSPVCSASIPVVTVIQLLVHHHILIFFAKVRDSLFIFAFVTRVLFQMLPFLKSTFLAYGSEAVILKSPKASVVY